MLKGYAGKVLRVNLTSKEITVEPLLEKIAKDYMGGAGFGLKYLFDEVDPTVEPLSSDNKIIFSIGPLTGSEAPCSSRVKVTAKSPLTGAVGLSSSGGYFPAELKYAGFDVVIIEGKSEEPVFLWIKNGEATLKDATALWGTNTTDCSQLIKDKLSDQNIRVACIGQAGENLSPLAAIINERHAAGRKGLGAVMGSKNLKAIAVRGTNTEVQIADPPAFKEARKKMHEAMKNSPVLYPKFSKFGTSFILNPLSAMGVLPIKNFAETGEHDFLSKFGPEAGAARRITNEYCHRCPVGCSQIKLAKEAPYTGAMSMPEFETHFSFGSMTMVDNVDAIIAADKMCDEYGLDTMSTGVAIAFAMELTEKGIITKEDTDGIDLSFGNAESMIEFVRRIAIRQGFGDILAEGVKKAAEKIGKGADQYAMHVKGLELPGYDVRGLKSHGLNYATAYTGADHNKGFSYQEVFGNPFPYPVDRLAVEGKGKLTKYNQDVRTVTTDCAPMCAFLLSQAVSKMPLENTAGLVTAATGIQFTPDDVYKVGERCVNTAKLFNLKAGFTRDDDDLPKRLKTEPLKDGGSKGAVLSQEELNIMLDEYYEARGWTSEGIPTNEKLKELGLL